MADVATSTATSVKRAPGDFLRGIVGRPVSVRLQGGSEYRGVLVCLDGYMNIALEQAEEYLDGTLRAKLGDCFLRGNNGARTRACSNRRQRRHTNLSSHKTRAAPHSLSRIHHHPTTQCSTSQTSGDNKHTLENACCRHAQRTCA